MPNKGTALFKFLVRTLSENLRRSDESFDRFAEEDSRVYRLFDIKPGSVYTLLGLQNLDLSIFKSFPLGEKVRLQLRGEAFNVTNSVTFAFPNTTFNTSSFGIIGVQGNAPRQVQVALRMTW